MTQQIKYWNRTYKIRQLITGEKVSEFETPVDLTVHTKAPEKWLLIDLETGQVYQGSEKPNLYGKWKRLEQVLTNQE